MSSNAEKLYKFIANDSIKKQSLFMTALTNPKKALDKICDIGNELNISSLQNIFCWRINC